jgi:hypothetical protein
MEKCKKCSAEIAEIAEVAEVADVAPSGSRKSCFTTSPEWFHNTDSSL